MGNPTTWAERAVMVTAIHCTTFAYFCSTVASQHWAIFLHENPSLYIPNPIGLLVSLLRTTASNEMMSVKALRGHDSQRFIAWTFYRPQLTTTEHLKLLATGWHCNVPLPCAKLWQSNVNDVKVYSTMWACTGSHCIGGKDKVLSKSAIWQSLDGISKRQPPQSHPGRLWPCWTLQNRETYQTTSATLNRFDQRWQRKKSNQINFMLPMPRKFKPIDRLRYAFQESKTRIDKNYCTGGAAEVASTCIVRLRQDVACFLL